MSARPLHVVIFAAKSTTDTKGSILDQIRACIEYAAGKGWIVDGKPESDEAASAYTGNRGPGLERAMERAEALARKHGRAGLLMWHPNRIARGGGDSPEAARHLVEYLFWAQRHDVELHAVREGNTFSNPILTVVMGEMAYQESKIKAANVRKGMARRRALGKHTGGQVYGMDRDPDLGLRPNAQTPVVLRYFQLIAAGKSQAEVARIFNREGIKTLRGKQWAQGTLSPILKNRTYLGEIRDDNGEWVEGKHDAIVPVELFEAANRVNAAAAAKKGRGGGRRPRAGHLLTGRIMRHWECGSVMTPVTLDPTKDGTVRGRYVCSGQKNGVCEGLRVDMAEVDETISTYLAEVGIDVEASLRLVRDAASARHDATAGELERAKLEAARAEESVKRVRGDYIAGKITAEDWNEFRPELEENKTAAAARVAQLEAKLSEGEAAPEVIIPAAAEALTLVRAALATGAVETVRSTIEALFSGFMIGTLEELPSEVIAGDPAARARLRATISAMEAAAGQTVADAEAQYWAEEVAMWDLGDPAPNPLDDGMNLDRGLVLFPMPNEDALRAIVEDGQPVMLADEEGRPVFRRLPFPLTYSDGLSSASSAPLSIARTRLSSSAWPLSTISGRLGSRRLAMPSASRTSRTSSMPSRPGRWRSSRTSAGRCLAKAGSASSTEPNASGS